MLMIEARMDYIQKDGGKQEAVRSLVQELDG